ncbi:hypothetical protein CPB97_007833 [Podila verticillata]|nr:hypothetical protein CPB97_007833 [Podila verticillata]
MIRISDQVSNLPLSTYIEVANPQYQVATIPDTKKRGSFSFYMECADPPELIWSYKRHLCKHMYFKSMIEGPFTENQHGQVIVRIQEINPTVFKIMLAFLGAVNYPAPTVMPLWMRTDLDSNNNDHKEDSLEGGGNSEDIDPSQGLNSRDNSDLMRTIRVDMEMTWMRKVRVEEEMTQTRITTVDVRIFQMMLMT